MTLDGFLTFLTLAAAIYALASSVARLRARFGLAIQIPVAVLALALVGYLEFFQALGQPLTTILLNNISYNKTVDIIFVVKANP